MAPASGESSSDSPLSVTGNIVGILTFVVAICASALFYWNPARSAAREYHDSAEELYDWSQYIHNIEYELEELYASLAAQKRSRSLDFTTEGAKQLCREVEEMLRAVESPRGDTGVHVRFSFTFILRWLRYRDDITGRLAQLRARKWDLIYGMLAKVTRQTDALLLRSASRVLDDGTVFENFLAQLDEIHATSKKTNKQVQTLLAHHTVAHGAVQDPRVQGQPKREPRERGYSF
ncbi:hypothetical protein Q7P37_001565 [Cladosporium fusiforme]